jgi:rRNA-processing protein FCF1
MEAGWMGCGERLARIVFDTSILLLLYDGVDVFEEAADLLGSKPECIIPKPVLEELKQLMSSRNLHKRKAAKLALDAIERRGCKIVETNSSKADDAILEIVSRNCGAIAATADTELRRRLRERGLPNIYYRSSRHGLMLEGG